jgi:hypothetical protein
VKGRTLKQPARKFWYGIRRMLEPDDFSEAERATIAAVRRYTKTSPERIVALIRSVEYVQRAEIPGAIVECGVWRGGSMMAAAQTLMEGGDLDRDLYLFDTFEGMNAPTDIDRDTGGNSAESLLKSRIIGSRIRCYADEADVRANMRSTGYPWERIQFVKGTVEETVPARAPEQIALLRLDTDWYESTKHELEHLYPRLSPRGALIIDDYGHWEGARKAVDEYFEGAVLLQRIDYSGRLVIKA